MSDRSRRSFFAPSRHELTALRALVAGTRDAREAWHRLAERGAIPASWLDDPARRFVNDPGDRYDPGRPTRDPALAAHETHPMTIEHCALFAADVAGVLAAESAARVLAERLAPWGAPPSTRVVWWTLGRRDYGYASTDTRPSVHYALPFAFNALHRALSAAHAPAPLSPFGHAEECAEAWRDLARRGVALRPDDLDPPHRASAGRTFADLPNPFEPFAAIEAAGYATLEYTGSASRGGAVFLVAPVDD